MIGQVGKKRVVAQPDQLSVRDPQYSGFPFEIQRTQGQARVAPLARRPVDEIVLREGDGGVGQRIDVSRPRKTKRFPAQL